jgi:RimJ/RimL family protein N-acetyltransferase
MRAPQQAKVPRKNVWIDCGNYFLRTLRSDDASDRWASWMADPGNLRLVNVAPTAMTRNDVAAYIEQFDQRSHLLIGIFEKQGGRQIGFVRVDIDHLLKRSLIYMMTGERKYRHWSVTDELKVPFHDFNFETLGLNMMLATVLASNRAMARFLLKTGWTLDKTLVRNVKSQSDGTMLDLCFFSLSRDSWRAWKQKNHSRK